MHGHNNKLTTNNNNNINPNNIAYIMRRCLKSYVVNVSI